MSQQSGHTMIRCCCQQSKITSEPFFMLPKISLLLALFGSVSEDATVRIFGYD